MIEDSEPLALTGVVVAEVLQGLTRDADAIGLFLAQWDMLEPRGFETYRTAAAIYRTARGKGVSLTTIDALNLNHPQMRSRRRSASCCWRGYGALRNAAMKPAKRFVTLCELNIAAATRYQGLRTLLF